MQNPFSPHSKKKPPHGKKGRDKQLNGGTISQLFKDYSSPTITVFADDTMVVSNIPKLDLYVWRRLLEGVMVWILLQRSASWIKNFSAFYSGYNNDIAMEKPLGWYDGKVNTNRSHLHFESSFCAVEQEHQKKLRPLAEDLNTFRGWYPTGYAIIFHPGEPKSSRI